MPELLLQSHFVRQPFPFLSPSGDIFPRPGEVFLKEGASGETEDFAAMPKPLTLGEVARRKA